MDKRQEKMVWDATMEEMEVLYFQEWLHPRIGLSQTEHTEKRINSVVCCLSCFTPIQANPSITACPECGCLLDNSMMETLRNNAFELSTYAWTYRNKYEKDARKGKIYKGKVATRYLLPPPTDWLTYLASIVLASIIGGLSYDVFKKILSKVAEDFRKRFKRELPKERWQQDFYNKLKEYFIGKRNPDSPIFMAYIKVLIRGAEEIATVKSSPKYEENILKLLKMAENIDENNSVEIPESLLETEEAPKELIEKQIDESMERIRNEELKIKQLRDYLRKITTTEKSDINNDDQKTI